MKKCIEIVKNISNNETSACFAGVRGEMHFWLPSINRQRITQDADPTIHQSIEDIHLPCNFITAYSVLVNDFMLLSR